MTAGIHPTSPVGVLPEVSRRWAIPWTRERVEAAKALIVLMENVGESESEAAKRDGPQKRFAANWLSKTLEARANAPSHLEDETHVGTAWVPPPSVCCVRSEK